MRTILILHFGGDQIRGSEVCLIHTIGALHAEGYRIVVLRKNACLDEHISGQVDVILDEDFPEIMFDGGHRALPLRKYMVSLRRLHKLVKHYRPSVIFCNGGLPCQLAVPVGRILATPVMCHFHHPAPKRYFYIWLVKYVTRLVFPSNFTRNHVAVKCGRDGEVIYNAIDVNSRFIPATEKDRRDRDELNIDRSKIVVGQVGHLSRHKRPDFLIRSFANALKQSANLHLVLVGYGPLYEDLQKLVEKLGLQGAVTLAGYVQDVLPYYQHVFDINVLASSEEGLGISVIEASACSVPSIVTDCTGLREVVDNQVTGLTYEQDSQDQLTDGILLLAMDPGLRRQYAMAARDKAVKTFGLEHYREKILEQVASLC
jgi:glycosyltransferase involved in cell wall biosynthesis